MIQKTSGGTKIMQKKMMLFALCFMCVGLISCTAKNENTSVKKSESGTAAVTEQTSVPTENTQPDKTEGTSAETSQSSSEAISDAQALDAIKNYCFISNPELKNIAESGEYDVYWDVTSNDAGEIVVLYRSYTGAQMHYYIDRVSGETYVTEMVPGVIDEEQRTDECFNVRDFLT